MLCSEKEEGQSISVNLQSENRDSIPKRAITEQSTLTTRSTSPIDERVVRLLLGEVVEGNFSIDAEQLESYDKKRSPRGSLQAIPNSTNSKLPKALKSPLKAKAIAKVDCFRSPELANPLNEAIFKRNKVPGKALQREEDSPGHFDGSSAAVPLQSLPSKFHVVDLLLSKIQVLKYLLDVK